MSAASSTLREKTPIWSSVPDCASTPRREMSPRVGLKPTTPQKDAGRMTEPLVCEPIASGTMEAPTAAAEPGGGAAGRARRVVRVARLARREDGELRRHRLADDDRARLAQAVHHRRVLARPAPLVEDRAVLGRQVARVDDVLQADRHAVQGAERAAGAAIAVGGLRLVHDIGRVEMLEGLHLGLALGDAREARLGDLHRLHRAPRDLVAERRARSCRRGAP